MHKTAADAHPTVHSGLGTLRQRLELITMGLPGLKLDKHAMLGLQKAGSHDFQRHLRHKTNWINTPI